MIKYYLLNGQKGTGHALDLLVDGKLKRDFIDISTLDLETMKIPRNNAKDILSEYNKDKNLEGYFYDAQYPFKKIETKAFAPIFEIEGKECAYYMNALRYFAEQRDYKKKNGQKVELDNNDNFDKYVRTICYNVLMKDMESVSNFESLIACRLKDEFEAGFGSLKGPAGYVTYRLYVLKSLLRNYTQMRNLTLEYMMYLKGEKAVTRSKLCNYSNYNNYGMEPREEIISKTEEEKCDKEIKYYQMTLSQFMDMK